MYGPSVLTPSSRARGQRWNGHSQKPRRAGRLSSRHLHWPVCPTLSSRRSWAVRGRLCLMMVPWILVRETVSPHAHSGTESKGRYNLGWRGLALFIFLCLGTFAYFFQGRAAATFCRFFLSAPPPADPRPHCFFPYQH